MLVDWGGGLKGGGIDIIGGNGILEKGGMGVFGWMDDGGKMVVLGD